MDDGSNIKNVFFSEMVYPKGTIFYRKYAISFTMLLILFQSDYKHGAREDSFLLLADTQKISF